MAIKRVYWVRLYMLVLLLCRYYMKNKNRLPADFPATAKTWLNGIEAVCEVLIEYDRVTVRGKLK